MLVGKKITSQQILEERKLRRKRLIIGTSASVVVLIGAFFIVMWVPRMRIHTIEISGTESLFPKDVSDAVAHNRSGRCALLPCNNRLVATPKKIERFVMKEFPRVSEVNAKYRGPMRLTLAITERIPEHIWCAPAGEKDTCWYMDETGFIFDRAPYFSDGVYLKWTGGRTTETALPIGDILQSYASVAKTNELIQNLRPQGTNIIGVRSVSNLHAELELRELFGYDMPRQSMIIINPGMPNVTIIETLRVLESNPGFIEQLTSPDTGLEYLDLRFPDKAYYRFSP